MARYREPDPPLVSPTLLSGFAGIFFGALLGYVIAAQQLAPQRVWSAAPVATQAAAAPVPIVDERELQVYRDILARDPKNARAAIELGNRLYDAGRYAEAIRAAEAALDVDPLLESVYRQLMRYHYRAGNKAQALKVYRNCEKLIGELFGDGLTPQTRHLFDIISNDAELDG